MLSLSVSFIHLELSAAKFPKEQALVLSMILFQRGRKMTELCVTRMELDYAFVEFRCTSSRIKIYKHDYGLTVCKGVRRGTSELGPLIP